MYCIVVYCRVCTVLYCKKSLIAQSNKWIIYIHTIHLVISKLNRVWLVVDLPPLKNMSSSVWVILPNWMEKNPPNHQPVCVYIYIHSAIHHGIFYFDEQWRGFSRFYQPAPALNADTMISEGQMQGLSDQWSTQQTEQPTNQYQRSNSEPIITHQPTNNQKIRGKPSPVRPFLGSMILWKNKKGLVYCMTPLNVTGMIIRTSGWPQNSHGTYFLGFVEGIPSGSSFCSG